MNQTFSNLFIFATGAAIGSLVTWKLLKTKYQQIANDEIESVKSVFSRRNSENNESFNNLFTPFAAFTGGMQRLPSP